jgi:hypothetical protein
MAHTRGASRKFVPDDGVLLGKGGVPLDRNGNPVAPIMADGKRQAPPMLHGHTVLQGPGAEPPKETAPVVGYRADRKSWSKQMTGWELACLLDMALRKPGDLSEGFTIHLTLEEYAALPGDLRQHFVQVRRK